MKHFLLSFSLSILCISLSAQSFNSNSSVSFGIKAGANISNMNFNKGYPRPAETIGSSWKPGFTAGLFMEVPVFSSLYIQPEYLYSYIQGEHVTHGETYTMHYLSLPVALKCKLGERLAVMAGPQFDILLKASKTPGAESDITHDTEERNIAALAGLEYKLLNFLSLNARYIHGINHIGIGQRSAVKEFKFEMAQLTAAITF